jgi:hypothetical protein
MSFLSTFYKHLLNERGLQSFFIICVCNFLGKNIGTTAARKMLLKLTPFIYINKIYEQLLRQFPFFKKLQTQTVSTEKLQKINLYEKAACKMFVKLTIGVNFINILQTGF